MKRFSVLLSIMFIVLLTQSVSRAADPLPKDVRKYSEQRENCYHMSGEIPDASEKERMREVIREMNKQCKGLDKEKLRLTKKYAANAIVTAHLAKVEDESEDILPVAPLAH